MTDPQEDQPAAPSRNSKSHPVTCSCGVPRPARHSVEITSASQTVIITSDTPRLSTVADIARSLFDHTRPARPEAAGFAGSAPTSAITERRANYSAPEVVPAYGAAVARARAYRTDRD